MQEFKEDGSDSEQEKRRYDDDQDVSIGACLSEGSIRPVPSIHLSVQRSGINQSNRLGMAGSSWCKLLYSSVFACVCRIAPEHMRRRRWRSVSRETGRERGR